MPDDNTPTKENHPEKPLCQTCRKRPAIPRGVPWGKDECTDCRAKTGTCFLCKQNRNSCCC